MRRRRRPAWALLNCWLPRVCPRRNSEARRTVGEGGAYVNNAKVTDLDAVLGASEALHGKYLLVRRGKRTLAMVELAG